MFQLRIGAGYIPFFQDLFGWHLLVKIKFTVGKMPFLLFKITIEADIPIFRPCFFVKLFLPQGSISAISDGWIHMGPSYIPMISPLLAK